jgi:hypothetical protein
MCRPANGPLLDHFSALEDSRQQAKVLHPLPEIILLGVTSRFVRQSTPGWTDREHGQAAAPR